MTLGGDFNSFLAFISLYVVSWKKDFIIIIVAVFVVFIVVVVVIVVFIVDVILLLL